jgi:hypothetical protein
MEVGSPVVRKAISLLLVLIGAYSVVVIVRAVASGKGTSAVFWTAIVVIAAIAVGSLITARWLARR